MKIIIIILIILSQYSQTFALNQRILDQIKYWESSKRLPHSIKRASNYIGIVLPIIKKYGLPERIALLPILESGYDCGAKSKAKALGCWQFMSRTGAEYGLKKTLWGDQRTNITKSTVAACKYLKRLYRRYKDWDLVLAAYNYGEGRLDRAMKREKTRIFWDLKTIPKETRDYVPKFLALDAMGIRIESKELITVRIKGVQSFSRIAGILRIKTKLVSDINPDYTNGNTPPGTTMIYLSPDWNRAGLCALGIAEC